MIKKKLAWIAVGTNAFVSFIQALILLKIIPFDIVVGGMMQSYEQAAIAVIVSLVVQCFIVAAILIAADIIREQRLKRFANGLLMFFTAYFGINIVLNLFGKTWFEKAVASLMCIINILCFVGILKTNKKECRTKTEVAKSEQTV